MKYTIHTDITDKHILAVRMYKIFRIYSRIQYYPIEGDEMDPIEKKLYPLFLKIDVCNTK